MTHTTITKTRSYNPATPSHGNLIRRACGVRVRTSPSLAQPPPPVLRIAFVPRQQAGSNDAEFSGLRLAAHGLSASALALELDATEAYSNNPARPIDRGEGKGQGARSEWHRQVAPTRAQTSSCLAACDLSTHLTYL